jgi:hypothetical protein
MPSSWFVAQYGGALSHKARRQRAEEKYWLPVPANPGSAPISHIDRGRDGIETGSEDELAVYQGAA